MGNTCGLVFEVEIALNQEWTTVSRVSGELLWQSEAERRRRHGYLNGYIRPDPCWTGKLCRRNTRISHEVGEYVAHLLSQVVYFC